MWKLAIRGFDSQARAETKENLKARRRARALNFTGVFDRCDDAATYAWRVHAQGGNLADMV